MTGPKILLVDDDGLFLLAHREELESAGYRIRTAHHGREALEIVREEEIDIAFVDLLMPGMDGIETCRGLKRVSPRTEVVILTGFPSQLSPRLRKFLEEEGGPESLNKPLRENELARTVEEIMGSRE
jgi:ATP-dependent Lon protease